MVAEGIQNVNPSVYQKLEERKLSETDYDNNHEDSIDEREVFDIIRHLQDPEHPLSLEELNVLDIESIKMDNKNMICRVEFTPTIPHCSMVSFFGLVTARLPRSQV